MPIHRNTGISIEMSESLKADAIFNKSQSEKIIELVNTLERTEKERREICEEIEKLRNQKMVFEKHYGLLTKCECKIEPYSFNRINGRCSMCNSSGCYLTEKQLDYKISYEKHKDIYMSIDLATEGGNDKTCIITFKKHENGTIEILKSICK